MQDSPAFAIPIDLPSLVWPSVFYLLKNAFIIFNKGIFLKWISSKSGFISFTASQNSILISFSRYSPSKYTLKQYSGFVHFKSGYFYSTPKNGVRLYFTGKAKTLLLPFAYFTIIGFILYLPFELIEAKRSIWRIFLSPGFAILSGGSGGVGNQPIWFLLSLFFSLMGFYILDKLRLKWLIIMFPLLGFSIYYFGYNMKLPLGLQSLPLGIFFFYVGYIFKNKIEKSKYIPLVLIISMLI